MITVLEHQTEYAPLPEIYQVELTAACDLQCPMCLRTTSMERKPRLLDLQLLVDMHARGEFACTSFIELQQAGEPTIHPKLRKIVEYLQGEVKLLVGMSTHGLNFKKAGVVQACLDLDALTVSIDSVDPSIYHKLRYPATLEKLLDSLRVFIACWRGYRDHGRTKFPLLEFQLIKTPLGGTADVYALKQLIAAEGWEDIPIRIRTQRDDFEEMDGRAIVGTHPRPGNSQICLNPFSSVSVNSDGDVVSCCMIFDPTRDSPNWYGNLKEQTLAEIWNGPRVKQMRANHTLYGPNHLPGQCAKCYCWSPTTIHQNIVRGILAAR